MHGSMGGGWKRNAGSDGLRADEESSGNARQPSSEIAPAAYPINTTLLIRLPRRSKQHCA
jgi:hypothetical protein